MNPLELIQQHIEEFTKTEKEIAIYILNNPHEIFHLYIADLVKYTKSSKSAVIRFTQKLGYNGYSDFRYELRRYLLTNDQSINDSKSVSIATTYSNYILQLERELDKVALKRLAKKIVDAQSIKIFGNGRTFLSADQLRQRLLKIFIDSQSFSDKSMFRESCSIYGNNLVAIVFTISDHYQNLSNLIKEVENGSKIEVITMKPNLPIKSFVDEYIVLPRISTSSYNTFLDDQVLFFVFIEYLISEIAKITN